MLQYAQETQIQACYLVLQRYILEVAGRKKSGGGGSMFVLKSLDAMNTKKIAPLYFAFAYKYLLSPAHVGLNSTRKANS